MYLSSECHINFFFKIISGEYNFYRRINRTYDQFMYKLPLLLHLFEDTKFYLIFFTSKVGDGILFYKQKFLLPNHGILSVAES